MTAISYHEFGANEAIRTTYEIETVNNPKFALRNSQYKNPTSDHKPHLMNWKKLSTPLKVGIIAAALGMTLAVIGILRGTVPANFLSIILALLISGLSWGIVAWAIATATSDVEHDLAEVDAEDADKITETA